MPPRDDWSAYWTEDTLTSLLARRAAEAPGAPAILTRDEAIDYATLEARVDALARGLSRLGIGRGDTVSVQLPNTPAFLLTCLAAARLGAVLSTIHMPYGPGEARDLMGHAETRLVVCLAAAGERRLAETMVALKRELPRLEHVVAVGGEPPAGALAFDDVAAGGDAALPPPPAAGDPWLMLFTSGTSASPKAVRTDYRRFLANARLNHTEKRMEGDSVMLSAAPFSHLLGLYSFQLALYGGSANALLPSFAPAALIDTCRALRPTHMFVAPAHVAACLAAGILDPEALDSVRYCVISGAMAPPDLYRRAQAALRNGRVAQLWGMTECQCGMFTRPDEPAEAAAAGCGRPSDGNRARVCGPDGAVLGPGEEGELQIAGASVFDGYYRNPEATEAAFTEDGWFRTGDLAVIAASGAVAITGRTKDVINRGGIKINPADVEAAIDRHPDIVQSAIVPMPDPVLGERSCCFAVARPGAAPTLETLTRWLAAEGIAKLKWPERLVLIEEMPLTPTRKVIKGRLRISD